ncbi:MAG: hypothetical protein M0Z40_14200 [Actinomycetota bacterium]|nr:hypothetical protein [Actinomycetota bacterium]MDA8317215.1 hypothetical protein [Actinomycetota bacterium]
MLEWRRSAQRKFCNLSGAQDLHDCRRDAAWQRTPIVDDCSATNA